MLRTAQLDDSTCSKCWAADQTHGPAPVAECTNPNGCRCTTDPQSSVPLDERTDFRKAETPTGVHGSVFQNSPCGCEVRGQGILPEPFHVVHCPAHAGDARSGVPGVHGICATNWTAGGGDPYPCTMTAHVTTIAGKTQVEVRLWKKGACSQGGVLAMVFPFTDWRDLVLEVDDALKKLPVILTGEGPES